MIQNFFTKFKDVFHDAANKLTGSKKRTFLAKTAEIIGKGGQSLVAKELHVSRDTIRKGRYKLETGIPFEDAFQLRGRKKVEEKLPNLLNDIKDIVDSQSQNRPKF